MVIFHSYVSLPEGNPTILSCKMRLKKSPAPLLPGAFFEDLSGLGTAIDISVPCQNWLSFLRKFLIHHGAWWLISSCCWLSSRISDTLSRMLGNIYIYIHCVIQCNNPTTNTTAAATTTTTTTTMLMRIRPFRCSRRLHLQPVCLQRSITWAFHQSL